jgi:hypothetical protein
MKNCLLLCVAVLALAVGVPASAQYMYIDENGDGVCNSDDIIDNTTTSVDVWLATNKNRDGSDALCPTGEDLSLISYSFILRSSGGLTYGTWVDAVGFGVNLGTGQAGNDRWVARGTGTPIPPDTYKLGTQNVTVSAGTPVLSIVTNTSAATSVRTTFGSVCPGTMGDNTMRLTVEWNDICGTASGTPVTETTWGKIKALYRGN